jgi:cell division septal protein FtsQ
VDGQGDIAAFSSRPDRADLPDLVDVIARGQTEGHVLAIYPEWQHEPALQKLQLARAALNAPRVMTYGTRLPPLAGAVFVSLASAVSRLVV